MEPLPFDGGGDAAMARLRRVVEGMAGARIVRADARSLHATFTTRVLRFVDDVELVVDDAAGVVHYRSASRVAGTTSARTPAHDGAGAAVRRGALRPGRNANDVGAGAVGARPPLCAQP
jgi:hypothetical protein